jgi:serine/threonine protein phosphatase PrpC
MTLLRLTPAVATHRGMRRRHNEDAVGYEYPTEPNKLQTYGALFVVADGVGGLSAGDKASTMAVEQLLQRYYAGNPKISTEERLAAAIQEVNLTVFKTLNRKGATTMVAVVITGENLVAASVGDSLIFLIQGDKVTQLNTEDVLRSGDEEDGALTKAIGYREDLDIETISGTLKADDKILLCSDGLTRYLDRTQLNRHTNLRDPRDSVRRMINLANQEGGADNISTILVYVGEAIAPEELAKHNQRMSVRVAVDTEPMMKADVPSKPTTMIPLSRPKPSLNEELLDKVELTPRHTTEPRSPIVKEAEATSGGNTNMLIIGAVIVLVIGALVLGISFSSFFSQPSATATSPASEAPSLESPSQEAPNAEASEAATITEDEAFDTELALGDTIRLEDDVITYARVNDNTVAAFVAEPSTPYQIIEIFTDTEGILWYRLSDSNSAQSGWVSENTLPPYLIQRD